MIPQYAPGIQDVTSRDEEADLGSRLEMRTQGGRVIEGRVVECRESRTLAVEDQRGIRNEWRLFETPEGKTLATHVIRGSFSDAQAAELRMEAMAKIMRFVRQIEEKERARRRDG